jgi:subtilisin family serine protease
MCKTENVKRNASRLSSLMCLLAGFILLPTSPVLYGQQLPRTEFVEIPYYADGSTELFEVALDQIGILPNAKASYESIASVGRSLNGEIKQAHNGGIFVIQRQSVETRVSLMKLARQIRDSRKDILQAGLVLYPKGSNTPLVISDELIVRFSSGTTQRQINAMADKENIVPVMQTPLIENLWLFRLEQNSNRDIVEVVKSVALYKQVEFTHPNIFAAKRGRQATSVHQWHHVNTGQGGPPSENMGTVDADVDTDLAWSLTKGSSTITIAVIDFSFDLNHPDLTNNTNAFSFVGCADPQATTCGSTNISATAEWYADDHSHGTAVAGLAAGQASNVYNFSGTCPQCTWTPVQLGLGAYAESLAISYAGSIGAHIVTSSWGYEVDISTPGVITVAIEQTAQTGAVMFWAMSNEAKNDCLIETNNAGVEKQDISANPRVIAVSAISNQEKKVNQSAYGDCMSILAPSHRDRGPSPNNNAATGVAFSGSLNIATTDRTGPGDVLASKNAGYNNERPPNGEWNYDPTYCPQEITDLDYTLCFGGTSAATPIVAGIGGLVLSTDASLTSGQVRRLLQDTADKVQDSIGKYSKSTGKSEPGGASTHGFGRVNAYEAVHVVAPVTAGNDSGLGGRDIFLRDNRLDWGNTKQLESSFGTGWSGSNVKMEPEREFIPHYQSVDIKVDAPDLVGNYRPPPTPLTFDDFTHENPVSGAVNRVYVRVHNRGPKPAEDVRVKLHWAMAGTALPPLPNDFWSVWPADSTDSASQWHTIGSQIIPIVGYSGASVAGGSDDGSQIVSFNFTGPPLDSTLPAFRHHCLFAVIDSNDDPVRETRLVPDIVTPTNNNVTHRNLSVQDPIAGSSSNGLMVRNPFTWPIKTRLKVIKPKRWKISLSKFGDGKAFELGAGEEVPVTVKIVPGKMGEAGDVEIRQEIAFKEDFQPFGGFVYRFPGK